MCWWEDEGVEPWEFSGPNNTTLYEAQREYLAESRPYRLRPGKVRAPKRREAREDDWQPYELSGEQLERIEREKTGRRRLFEEEQRREAQEVARNPEGPFKDYNAAVRRLVARAPAMTHAEIKSSLRELDRTHGFTFTEAQLEMSSRRIKDEDYYRRHPMRSAWWLLRYARPGTVRHSWTQLRTGTFVFAIGSAPDGVGDDTGPEHEESG